MSRRLYPAVKLLKNFRGLMDDGDFFTIFVSVNEHEAMEKASITRREFLKNLGLAGAGVLMASSPWLSAFAESDKTSGYKVKIGIIGPGSRGQFLMSFLTKNPKADIVALCDIYQPSIDEALKMVPKAKVYRDYRALLDDPNVDAVVITTPLDRHYEMAMAALDAGKDLFCEKALCYTLAQCYEVYQKHLSTGRILFVGQQRLFDPRYIKVMKMIIKKIFACMVAISAVTLTACGNMQMVDTTWNYNKAVISLPDGTIVEGNVESWKDYADGDQIQVKIDGVTYLVHSGDVVLISGGTE